MQIAFTISQNDEYFKNVYDRQMAAGKHHKVALSHVAAKLLEVVCALWRSGRKYTVEKPAGQPVNNNLSGPENAENTPLLNP